MTDMACPNCGRPIRAIDFRILLNADTCPRCGTDLHL